ncbi:MAG: Ig-like domain-containing protein, partial [Burkholderiaceae bacterium]
MSAFIARRLVGAAILLAPLVASAVGVRFDPHSGDPESGPFPSDRFTVRDWSQNTFRRIALPKPDCTVRVSDCEDIDVINRLDGFSTQPRISVPFDGDIDVNSVDSSNVFLLNLGDTLSFSGFGDKVGINQVLWDPATKTLAFQPDELLAEHTRYLLIVTDGVRDANGKRIRPSPLFERLDHARGEHERDLRDALRLRVLGHGTKIAAASLFTTQSISADLYKIMRDIKRSHPAPADFMIGSSGGTSVRALFPVPELTGIQWNRQTGTAPSFTLLPLPLQALGVVPGAVAQIAWGKFRSLDYQ